MKIGFPCHTLAVCLARGRTSMSHDGPYIQSRDRTFTSMSFRENLIFSQLSAYSLTPKANKGFLRPSNTDYNLHAK
jgi:hypothetical protein